jgi:hypothetical protein
MYDDLIFVWISFLFIIGVVESLDFMYNVNYIPPCK